MISHGSPLLKGWNHLFIQPLCIKPDSQLRVHHYIPTIPNAYPSVSIPSIHPLQPSHYIIIIPMYVYIYIHMCNYMYIYVHMAVTENEGCPHNRNFMDKKMINHVVLGCQILRHAHIISQSLCSFDILLISFFFGMR